MTKRRRVTKPSKPAPRARCRKRKPIQLFNRSPKVLPPAIVTEKKLIVVGTSEQVSALTKQKPGEVILTAQDIEANGVFSYAVTEVTWTPGWALFCSRPEIVCERVFQRLKSQRYTGV